MRLEQFFEKFELFADAPNAVGKMRELVLELAVTGRLIPPESEWLKRPLKSLATKIGSGATPAGGRESYFSEGIPLIRSMNVHFRGFDRAGLVFLSKEQARQLANVIVQPGDVLLNITGASIGRVTIAPPEMAEARVNQHVTIIRPAHGLLPSFLKLVLASPSEQRMIDDIQVGATRQALTKSMIEQFEIPLPPLAEQKRIVAKVDELMALCDRLEAQLQERDTRHVALARASLTRFAEAPTPANLDFLFRNSYPITPADLRKAILSLAVQGKLVPQDPNDEPADAMLDRIVATAKSRHRANGGSTYFDAPFEIPECWTWVKLPRVLKKLTDGTHHSPANGPSGDFMYVTAKNIKTDGVQLDGITFVSRELHEEIYSRCNPSFGDILYIKDGATTGVATINQIKEPFSMLSSVALLKPSEAIFNRYLLWVMRSPFFYAETRGAMKGAAITRVTLSVMAVSLLPLPPLAEQRRIVAKVDQLMAMVDQLEARLADSKAKSTALLDAVIHELLNPTAEIVDLAAYRAAMACYAIRKMASKPYFGRTAAMKLFYLAQAHVGLELGLKPVRDAAGPLDQWIYDFEREGAREDWFRVAEGSIANGKTKIAYQPSRMLGEQSALAARLLSDSQRKEYDRLLSLFADRTTEEAEIIATLFAAWNDFLIDGHTPDDDRIVTEVREHWHEKKARFTSSQLRQWLAWLRQNNLVPTGRLPHTVHQAKLLLN